MTGSFDAIIFRVIAIAMALVLFMLALGMAVSHRLQT